ncbi:response regulator [Patescibacteria group bacterium]|nr:response regulator [Patescibacteria group bacterium]
MKRIVFIEDEPALQKILGEALSKEGYEVIAALDGEAGLRLVETKKPDLVLLDLILPKIDGFEVLRRIKEDPETREIPIIILTNLERMEDVDRVSELGAITYLVKDNYTLEEVVEKIKKAIGE